VAFAHQVIEFAQAREEVVRRHLRQGGWNQRFHLDLVEVQFAPGLARQDHELARDVGAGQVVARVRLGVAQCMGLAHQFRERLHSVDSG
jgi:hypothetical protein